MPGEGVEVPIYRRNRTSARLDGSEWDYEVVVAGKVAYHVFADRDSFGNATEWTTDTGLVASSLPAMQQLIAEEIR